MAEDHPIFNLVRDFEGHLLERISILCKELDVAHKFEWDITALETEVVELSETLSRVQNVLMKETDHVISLKKMLDKLQNEELTSRNSIKQLITQKKPTQSGITYFFDESVEDVENHEHVVREASFKADNDLHIKRAAHASKTELLLEIEALRLERDSLVRLQTERSHMINVDRERREKQHQNVYLRLVEEKKRFLKMAQESETIVVDAMEELMLLKEECGKQLVLANYRLKERQEEKKEREGVLYTDQKAAPQQQEHVIAELRHQVDWQTELVRVEAEDMQKKKAMVVYTLCETVKEYEAELEQLYADQDENDERSRVINQQCDALRASFAPSLSLLQRKTVSVLAALKEYVRQLAIDQSEEIYDVNTRLKLNKELIMESVTLLSDDL
ncbi:hypothetical protein PCE1_000474 [Barthelona sp. PCE]